MNFYKIENNKLISGSGTKLPDDAYSTDWSVLAAKEDGSFYDFYNADGTVNAELQMQHDTTNILQSIESSIQDMIDNKAKELGYDNMVSACSYAGYENEFQLEAIALGKWRSSVWNKAYELQNTMTTVPTVEEVLSQLPEFEGGM